MASTTGKKGKKSKEKKLSLQDFLAKSGQQAGGTTQVAVQKFTGSWADECEEDEERKIEIIQLPTAPRAARILDDNSIPNDPPFYAKVSNLPFDLSEDDVDEFFQDHEIQVKEMKLARDDANDRLRGFGHIEFKTRDDLLDAIMMSDTMIGNRRIRIEYVAELDSISGRTVRRRYDNNYSSGNDSSNWRDRKESSFETVDGGRDGGGRENRRNFQPRSNFQNRHETNNNDDSNWRLGDRPNDSPPPERRRNFAGNNDRRDGRGRYDRDRDNRRDQRSSEPAQERPKINIAPRTLPLPELNFPKEEELERGTRKISLNNGDNHHENHHHSDDNHDDSGLPEDSTAADDKNNAEKPKPIPRENIFGLARPVDTAARERIIEEKMEQGRQERMKAEKEKREAQSSAVEAPQNFDANKKDVIVFRTESSRRQEESSNWRKRDDTSSNGSIDNNKNRGGNRHIGRNDDRDRPRQFNKDNRNYNRGGDFRRDSRGDNRRDNNMRRGDNGPPPRRGGDMGSGNDMRRDDREPREPRDRRDRNYDMPKFVENSGPNLKTSNAFAGLDDEVYDD